MNWITYALLTVASWGVYGVLLHKGRSNMPMGPEAAHAGLKAFLFVCVAYALIGLASLALLKLRGSNWSFNSGGITWSLIAGGAGAIGAFTLVLALGAAAQIFKGGAAAAVMPIVFSGAPIVNTIVAMAVHPPEGGLKSLPLPFVLGCVLAAGGAFLVAKFAPTNTVATPPPAATQNAPVVPASSNPPMASSVHPDRAAIESSQLEQLRSLVVELIPANNFYTQKLQAAGVGFDISSLADFSRRFPFTTKQELVADQLANAPHGTNLTYPVNRYTRFHQTSGTSGVPMRWLDTPENWDAMIESWSEIFRAAEIGAGDRVMFAFSFGPFLGFWLAFEAAERLGCLCLPGGGLSSAARLRMMRDNKANVVCCTPTYAMRLAQVAMEERIEIPSLGVKTIIVAGEPGGSIPATRAKLESLWPGARIFDHHGMTEVGPVTYECPARPGVLHVIESAFFAEIVDPVTSQPAASGELILTTLTRTGSPLLRYRTGDMVKCEGRSAKCECGRSSIKLSGGILGRVDDMVIVRGVNVYPSAVEEILRRFDDVAEYQVQVSQAVALTELRVELEPTDRCADVVGLKTSVRQALETAFNLRIPVETVAPGSLPRFEMKAKRWVRTCH